MLTTTVPQTADDLPSWQNMTELQQAQCTYWDMYKDAYGVRPRGQDTTSWTMADFRTEFDRLAIMIERDETDRIQQEQEAVKDFEALVLLTQHAGAPDRTTALEWIMQAQNGNGDWEYLAYSNGLPWNYFDIKE